MTVKVIGAGLAGSEAAWQLAQRGIDVQLYEMKPQKMTPAHHSPYFAVQTLFVQPFRPGPGHVILRAVTEHDD